MLHHFLTDRNGNVAVIFALSAVPLIGIVGVAVDYGVANSARASMQASVDAAALTVARDASRLTSAQIQERAQQHFENSFKRSSTQNVTVSTASGPGGATIQVSASGAVPVSFTRVLSSADINISVSAVAAVAKEGLGCVLSLDPSARGATSIQGMASVTLKRCSLYDNSGDSSALTVGGSSSISALSVDVVGNISGRAGITTTEGITTGASPIRDPYESVNFPPYTGCDRNHYTVRSNGTIRPGVYCNGITVNAGATLTLDPGTYYIDRGTFAVNGGATVNGQGVTIVFTSSTGSNYASASFNGGATINLTAPTTGETAGIVMFGDRAMPIGTPFKFEGGTMQTLNGAIYTPRAEVSFSGGSGSGNGCTKMVGNTLKFTGNSSFEINCEGLKTKPIGGINVRLIQ